MKRSKALIDSPYLDRGGSRFAGTWMRVNCENEETKEERQSSSCLMRLW